MMAPVVGSGCWPAWMAMVPSPRPAVLASSFMVRACAGGGAPARPRPFAEQGRQDSPALGGAATWGLFPGPSPRDLAQFWGRYSDSPELGDLYRTAPDGAPSPR